MAWSIRRPTAETFRHQDDAQSNRDALILCGRPERDRGVRFTMLDSTDDANAMPQTRILDDLSARISEFLAASPAKDVEKNLQALLSAAFAKLDLATRAELDIQAKVLARARDKLSELEARVAELESRLTRK